MVDRSDIIRTGVEEIQRISNKFPIHFVQWGNDNGP